MSKAPPVREIEFIKLTANHQELVSRLGRLGIPIPDVSEYASHVTKCWYNLALEHLAEAKLAVKAKMRRTAYSRAYYAAYNASKAARYFCSGAVSLKGDDHRRAGPDLPNDLSDVEKWSRTVTVLYEHRLRADYDNWADSADENTISTSEAIKMAGAFVREVRKYLKTKYGITL